MKTKKQRINIRDIFKEKNPKLAPFIPGFIYSWLSRILHLDFVNYFLDKHGDKRGIEFALASLEEFNITLELKGEENLPGNGRFIFVSNHPLGGFDGMILITILAKKYQNLKVLVNDILMNIQNMDDIFVPINKHGKQSFEAVREIEEIFRSDHQVLTFPSGLVSRKKNGIIRDPEWKKNFISKSVKHKRDVVPVFVSGRCTNFFYRLARLRKLLGIKANLEMFFLPDETYRHKNEKITVIIGKPLSWEIFDKRHSYSEWARRVQDYVYTLPEGKGKTFDKN